MNFVQKKNLIDVYDSFERYHELRLINNKNSQLPFCYSITNVISVVMFPNFEYFRLVRILQFVLTSGSPSRLQRRRPRRDSEESGIGWIRQTIDLKHYQVSTTYLMPNYSNLYKEEVYKLLEICYDNNSTIVGNLGGRVSQIFFCRGSWFCFKNVFYYIFIFKFLRNTFCRYQSFILW